MTAPVGFSGDGAGHSIMHVDNVDFTNVHPYSRQITADGQLLIGSTATPNIRTGTLGSSDSSITWTVGAGTITGQVTGGTTVGKTITGDIGGALSPVAGNWNILGASTGSGTTPIQTSGSGNTLAIQVQRAQAVAAADTTKVGLANFNSSQFSVSNGFVSIIAGGFVWNDITGATQTIVVENGYVTDRGGGVTYTLPATASFGDEFIITGKSGLWTLAQNANQSIGISSSATTTVGVGGSLAATNAGDSVWAVCTTAGASTVWRVYNFVGNITVT